MTKLEKIDINLDSYRINLHFQNQENPLVLHFDTPARRFYFSLVALVVIEMKAKDKPDFIHIRKYEKTLKLLDNLLTGQNASKTVESLWDKIRKAWRYTLPDLETGIHFKILERHLIPPYEKGGKYRYNCSNDECDAWANLFDYDESNPWRFKFAVDSVSLSLHDILLTYGNLKNNDAWQEFIKRLSEAYKTVDVEKESIKKKKYKQWHWPAVVIVALLILFIAGIPTLNRYFRPAISPTKTQLPDKPSIAVLPFVNVGGDPDKEYFSDGITEELINTIAKLRGLRVISQTSSFFFKGKNLDISSIGKKLKVDTVLEGSVRTEDSRLRITAQLIKVADDSHIWAETYDCEMKDLFAIQEEISQTIVDKLKPRLLGKRDRLLAKHYTENVEAHGLYLKGRYFWNKMLHKNAIEYFEQAIALDPKYALAYAGLADAYNRMAFFYTESVTEYYIKAKYAVMKALEIDDMLSEAHAAIGYIKLHYEWDWKGAEKALKRAIELNPGNALAHRYYSSYLRAIGRLEEALAEMQIALELDPLSRGINDHFGLTLIFDRQFEKAIKQLKKTLELYPDHPMTLMFLGIAYLDSGNYEDGTELLEKAVNLTKRKAPLPLGRLGHAYGVAGKREKAQKILDEVLERLKRGSFAPNMIAVIYMGLSDKEKAFKMLEKAYEERHPTLYSLKTIPVFRSLHSDPRFIALLKKMGLEE